MSLLLKICGFLPKHRISYFMLLVNTYFTIYIRKSELFEIIPLNFDITIAKSVFSSSNTDTERREVRFEMGKKLKQ